MRTITRRLVPAASFLVVFLALTTSVAFAGGPGWEFERYPQPGEVVEWATTVSWSQRVGPMAAKPESEDAPPAETKSEGGTSVRFDTLWLSIVGVVGLLLVVWMVRVQSAWDRDPAGRRSGNESRPRDVSTDE